MLELESRLRMISGDDMTEGHLMNDLTIGKDGT